MTDRDPIQTLWADQPSDGFVMSLADIRARASRLQSVIGHRNMREYIACAVLIVIFTTLIFVMSAPLAKLGNAMTVAGLAYVMWRLSVVARAATPDEMLAVESLSQFYRRELVRQRDALSTVWRWYLGPLIPGQFVAWLASLPVLLQKPYGWLVAAIGLAMTVAVFTGIGALNKWGARKLQAEIDALDAAGVEKE